MFYVGSVQVPHAARSVPRGATGSDPEDRSHKVYSHSSSDQSQRRQGLCAARGLLLHRSPAHTPVHHQTETVDTRERPQRPIR